MSTRHCRRLSHVPRKWTGHSFVCIHILCLNHFKFCILCFTVGGGLNFGVIGEPLALVQPIEVSANVFAALTFDTWAACSYVAVTLRTSQPSVSRDRRLVSHPTSAPAYEPRVRLSNMAAFKALCSADSVFFRTLSGFSRARLNSGYLQLNKVGTETLPITHWLINY